MRWSRSKAQVAAALRPAIAGVRETTGLAFDPERLPIVVYEDAAPTAGEVALRFVDGVRRPVIRLASGAVLAGDFQPAVDLPPLVARAALLAAAGERSVPRWILDGVPLVAADVVERRLHERALAEAESSPAQTEFVGSVVSDPLAAALRVRAIVRCARAQRPLAQFVAAIVGGATEDRALVEVGIEKRAFLDAAAETERERAIRVITDDPLWAPLRAARTALRQDDAAAADAALASAADQIERTEGDPWLTADARLLLARIAVLRGEWKSARANLEAARAQDKVVRPREARVLDAATGLLAGEGAASLRAIVPADVDPRDAALRRAATASVGALQTATSDADPIVSRVAADLLALAEVSTR